MIECHQYKIRKENLEQDLKDANLTEEEASRLTVDDFTFKVLDFGTDKQQIKEFIKKHEWLGTYAIYNKNYFACYYKDILAGVLVFNVPNGYSKILGENTKDVECLISRGACISWSPINLASKFIAWAIKWAVQNTDFRLFVGYSDPQAGELGTIYQALNFYYLGNKFGMAKRYVSPWNGNLVSDRLFRDRDAYKKYAKELGYVWQDDWTCERHIKIAWHNIPDDIEAKLRAKSKQTLKEAEMVIVPLKHKYCFVLGKNKKETRELRKRFTELNKVYPYPKVRGE